MAIPSTAHLIRPRLAPLAVLALGAALAVGCSSSDSDTATTTTAAPSTTAGTTAGTARASGTTVPGGDKAEPTGTVGESDREPWDLTAQPYRGQIGETVEYDCPAGGEPGRVWGANLYTDDSSVCTAAVQVGLITFEDGGTVTILIEEGADEYQAATANGVESTRYASWGGSFSFPDADELDVATGILGRPASFYVDQAGEVITVTCTPDGAPGNVWGTETYTDDSSICTAAVHAGIITFDDGGEVSFELVDGLDAYEGTSANGVDSEDYGSWSRSFVFVDG